MGIREDPKIIQERKQKAKQNQVRQIISNFSETEEIRR